MAVVKRPTIITWLCVLVLIGIAFSFPLILFPSIRGKGSLVPMVYGIIITLRFASIIGVWHMKKWGVLLFLAAFFMNLVFELTLDLVDAWTYIFTIINFFFIIVFLRHYKRMSDNL